MSEVFYKCRFCEKTKPQRKMTLFEHNVKECKACRKRKRRILGPNVKFARPQYVCPVVKLYKYDLKDRERNRKDREKNRIRKNEYRKNNPNSRKGESQFRQRNIYKQRRIFSCFRSEITEIYKNCPEGHQVDHIIPILNDKICGLHVPWNLQYLPNAENNSKHNKWDGTMSNETWRKNNVCSD